MGIHYKFELLLKIFFNGNDLKEDIKSPLGDLGVKKYVNIGVLTLVGSHIQCG
jgi:hypothetical protein